mgnify:CR=1 FL=1
MARPKRALTSRHQANGRVRRRPLPGPTPTAARRGAQAAVTTVPALPSIVGDSGKVLLSSDGANWTAYASDFDGQLAAVGTSGSLHIAVGNDGAILSSGDGALWVRQQSPAAVDLLAVTHP